MTCASHNASMISITYPDKPLLINLGSPFRYYNQQLPIHGRIIQLRVRHKCLSSGVTCSKLLKRRKVPRRFQVSIHHPSSPSECVLKSLCKCSAGLFYVEEGEGEIFQFFSFLPCRRYDPFLGFNLYLRPYILWNWRHYLGLVLVFWYLLGWDYNIGTDPLPGIAPTAGLYWTYPDNCLSLRTERALLLKKSISVSGHSWSCPIWSRIDHPASQ